MSLIEKIFGRLEGAATPAGFRPKGWEIPSKMPGDSNGIMTTGNADGTHTIARLPKIDNGQVKPQERKI